MRNLAYRTLAVGLLLAASLLSANAQWTAYNDHFVGTTTHPNATTYNVYGFTNAAGFSGPLKNIATGATLPVTLTITNLNLPSGGASSGAPSAGTPAYTNFNGFVHFGSGGNIWHAIIVNANTVVAHVFSNLVAGREYRLVATGIRGGGYADRWTIATLVGPSSFVSAHSPGVLTTAQVPALAANQAAMNTGANNTTGDVVYWDRIVAPANGVIAVLQSQYTGTVPGGSSAGSYGYAFQAIKLQDLSAPVAITTQPANTSVCLGGTATLTVGVTGTQPFYQWRKNGVAIPNATNATLVIPNATAGDAGTYSVVVTNFLNSVTSANATLTVASTALTLLGTAPTNQVVGLGSNAVFVAVTTAGSQPITYQWYSNTTSNNTTGTLIAGATNATLVVPGVSLSSPRYYYAVVGNCVGTVRTRVALLTPYVESIVITQQPQDVTTLVGGNATFTVTATGSALRYQWYKVGSPDTALPNATNRTVTLNNLQIANSGLYYVRVYNDTLSVNSSNAVLVVNSPPYLAYAWNGTNTTGIGTNFWRYDQSGTDKGTAWKEVSYPAADSWPQGRGVLAWEDNGAIVPLINTTLSLSNGTTRVRTHYFRTTFVITNDPTTVQLIVSNLVDDGAVFWVNGQEVYRTANMPAGAVNYRTLANSAATENSWFVFTVPGSRLQEGTNVMAVELHSNSDTSSDAVFGQALMVGFPAWTPVQITNQPASLIVEEAKPAAFTVGHSGGPAYYQWYKWSGNTAVPVTGNPTARRQTFVISNALTTDAGFYFATVSNIVSYTVSSNAQLVVIPDTNAPIILEADGTQANTNVLITFNEEVRIGTAPNSLTNTANYTVTNTFGGVASVLNATFLPPNQVRLRTAARALGSNWIVTVRTVTDVSPRANTANNIAAPISTYLTLIGLGDTQYRYNQPIFGIDPNPAGTFNTLNWTTLTYNENDPNLAGWADGASAFHRGAWSGYEMQAPEGSSISQNDQITGVYVRRPFNFTASPAGLQMAYRYSVADGAVFYLNGVEYDRYHMPPGQPTITTAATAQGGTYSAPVWQIPTTDYIPLPASFIRYGTNMFASEFHGVTSTELAQAFAAELRAKINSYVVGRVVVTRPPTNVVIYENDPAYFEPVSVGGRTFVWYSNNVAITGATNPAYMIARTPLAANGSRYKCTITGAQDSQTTAEALLTVLPDTNAPTLLSAYYTGPNTVSLYFSEPVNAADAVNRAYYYVTNALTGTNAVAISSVQLLNGTNAIITFASVLPLGNYTVVVSQIRDLATTPNKIATNSPVTVGLQNYALITMDTNSIWRYNEDDVDLGTAWRGRNFNDAAWPSGRSVFDGSSSAPGRNVIGGMAVGTRLTSIDRDPNPPTLYFRRAVNIPVFGPGATMTIRHIVDDGFALYANSNLCYAIGVTTPTSHGAWATRTVGDGAIEGPFSVPTTNLVAGTNIFAAELKNVNSTSSDNTFGLELLLNVPSLVLPPGGPTAPPVITNVPPLRIARQGSNVSVSWTNTGAALTLQYTTNLVLGGTTTWLNVPNQANPYVVPTTTNVWRYFRLRNP